MPHLIGVIDKIDELKVNGFPFVKYIVLLSLV